MTRPGRRPRLVLLGARGQLGADFRKAHAAAGEPFELHGLARGQLDVASADAESRLAAQRFDILVNCTGYHKTDEAEDNPALAFQVNTEAVRVMARVCARKKARLTHISTDYVFGGDAARRAPLAETAPVAPVNVYGASKALGEVNALEECDDVLVLRVASLFGVRGASAKGGNFVETIINAGRRGPLRVVHDQFMSPTGTHDVARTMVRALVERATGVYHVVNTGAATWFDFAKAIIRRVGIDTEVTPCASSDYPTRARRPAYSVLDNAKATADFGEMATWRDALDRYLRAKAHIPPVG